MIAPDSVYQIGQITRTHGVRGEVNFSFTHDVFDRAEAEYLVLDIDGILTPFYIEEYRFRSDTAALVKFVDYDTATQACELCGAAVYFPHALTPALADDEEYTWQQLLGFAVEDATVGTLGRVDAVDDTTQNVLLNVGAHLIPAVPAFVQRIDVAERIIYVDVPAEILHLNP